MNDNKYLIALMGKSGTGKDTVMKKLTELGCDRIITHTTRPPRPGEQEGREYHFHTEEDYQRLYLEGRILDDREYNAVNGIWRYWTESFTLDNKTTVTVTTPDSIILLDIYMWNFENAKLIPVYLELPEDVRLGRLIAREKAKENPDFPEMARRLQADAEDFSEEHLAQTPNLWRIPNRDEKDLDKFIRDLRWHGIL